MKKVLYLFAVLLAACAPCGLSTPSVFSDATDAGLAGDTSPEQDSVWVCHNPESEWHGSVCNEECYWVGFQRSENSYCWLLTEDDCRGKLNLEWQRENCHLLREGDGCE